MDAKYSTNDAQVEESIKSDGAKTFTQDVKTANTNQGQDVKTTNTNSGNGAKYEKVPETPADNGAENDKTTTTNSDIVTENISPTSIKQPDNVKSTNTGSENSAQDDETTMNSPETAIKVMNNNHGQDAETTNTNFGKDVNDVKIAEMRSENDAQYDKTIMINTKTIAQDVKTVNINQGQDDKTIMTNLKTVAQDVKMDNTNQGQTAKTTNTNSGNGAENYKTTNSGIITEDVSPIKIKQSDKVKPTNCSFENGAPDVDTTMNCTETVVKVMNNNQGQDAKTTNTNFEKDTKDVKTTEMLSENSAQDDKTIMTSSKTSAQDVKTVNINQGQDDKTIMTNLKTVAQDVKMDNTNQGQTAKTTNTNSGNGAENYKTTNSGIITEDVSPIKIKQSDKVKPTNCSFENGAPDVDTTMNCTETVVKVMNNNQCQDAKTTNTNFEKDTKDVKTTEMLSENSAQDDKTIMTSSKTSAQDVKTDNSNQGQAAKTTNTNSGNGAENDKTIITNSDIFNKDVSPTKIKQSDNVKPISTVSENGAHDDETTMSNAETVITTNTNFEKDIKDVKITEMRSENGAQDDKTIKTNPKTIAVKNNVKAANTKQGEDAKATNTNSGNGAKDVIATEVRSWGGTQVISITENHSYKLDETALEQILMKEDVKDLPVVAVSVVGVYRGGKSFLLNFFLRYLTSTESARRDGSWLGEDSAPLKGFQWRSGSVRTTLGIIMWSEPFILTRPSGEKVAVLLIDTQGTFDSTSTVNDSSVIFALSTLLSSVQIYNLSQNIQEDDLQFLQLFTDYGRMVKNQKSKAFQVLEFLVRDWQFPWEHPYGAVGGEQLLQEKLEIVPNLSKDMIELRKHIRTSFEKVSCFLMPHPGLKVLEPDFEGNISDISSKFKEYVGVLVTSLFSSDNLSPKTVNGKTVKARDLYDLLKTYMTVFKSGEIPTLSSIIGAIEKANLLSVLNEATAVYEKGMDLECGPDQPSMPAVDVYILHFKYTDLAQEAFTSKIKMGSKEDADQYLDKLVMELEKRLPQFEQSSLAKTKTLINEAIKSYEEAVEKFSNNQPLCVHPLDLEKVHKAGRDAALETFDANRKRITNKDDDEREEFIQSLLNKRSTLEQPNQRNNALAVSQQHLQYKQHMMNKISSSELLSLEEFRDEHYDQLEQAIEDFKAMRNIRSEFTEDVYIRNLKKAINDSFKTFSELNDSKNRKVIDAAVDEFDSYIQYDQWSSEFICWNTKRLDDALMSATRSALRKLYPNKSFKYYQAVINGYSDNSIVEDLMRRVKYHQDYIISRNDYHNKLIVNDAFNKYKRYMRDNWTFWSFTSTDTYNERARMEAIQLFLTRRSDHWSVEVVDDHYKNLLSKMTRYFKQNY